MRSADPVSLKPDRSDKLVALRGATAEHAEGDEQRNADRLETGCRNCGRCLGAGLGAGLGGAAGPAICVMHALLCLAVRSRMQAAHEEAWRAVRTAASFPNFHG